MRISRTRSDAPVTSARADEWQASELVGRTPLVTLQRSGGGRVHLKLESLSLGGSYFDRVAERQVRRSRSEHLVALGLTAWSVSLAARGAVHGRRVELLVTPEEPKRLLGMAKAYGASVTRCRSEEERAQRLAELEDSGAELQCRSDASAHRGALQAVATEVVTVLGFNPDHWVLPDWGPGSDVVRSALTVTGTQTPLVTFVSDDGEIERAQSGEFAARRTQLGHREGILVGPMGAEVVETAVQIAVQSGREEVLALVPDGGNRYLGWW